ncbi:MAG TPA: hypothetical protein PLO89_07900, partial [Spirochaetota bacterium]|nr:hypothetical protein [Spirochaetota bacterium]
SGIAALSASFSTTQDASGNEIYYQNEYGKYLVPMGSALLGLSSVSFVGIFVFSFLMYFASPYNFNQTQGKSFINNYNNFLKKKLGIPKDINLSYDFKNNKFDLSMSINF